MIKLMIYRVTIFLSVLLLLLGCRHRQVTLNVIETTDLHGAIFQEFAGAAKYILQSQDSYGKNLILLDGGDNLQGTAEVVFSNYIDTLNPHINTSFFNGMRYTAMAVGNHDIEAGEVAFRRMYSKLKVPVLCANIVQKSTDQPLFKPYVILKREGFKIAILGLLTPSALEWMEAEYDFDFQVTSMDQSASYWVRHIQELEHPDVLIGLFHAGLEESRQVAMSVPGFHLICCGHVHTAGTQEVVNNSGDTIWMMQAGSRASHLAQAQIQLVQRGKNSPYVRVRTQLFSAVDLPEQEGFLDYYNDFLARFDQFFDKPVCNLEYNLYSRDAMNGPSAWVDEFHRLYLNVANDKQAGAPGADISFASPAYRNLMLKKGPLAVSDFFSIYPYENTMSVMQMTGKEIKDYLEYSYSLRLDAPDGPAYNFDSAAGIIYRVYRNHPRGQRVEILSMADGTPFSMQRYYKVAMNTFRANGGGGHVVKALHWTPQNMREHRLWESPKDLRSLLIAWETSRSPLAPEPLYHWTYL